MLLVFALSGLYRETAKPPLILYRFRLLCSIVHPSPHKICSCKEDKADDQDPAPPGSLADIEAADVDPHLIDAGILLIIEVSHDRGAVNDICRRILGIKLAVELFRRCFDHILSIGLLRIFGEKGWISIPRFYAPDTFTLLLYETEETQTFSFELQGEGFQYELEAVMACIDQGLTECPRMPWAESVALMSVMDDLRSQIGLKFPTDRT